MASRMQKHVSGTYQKHFLPSRRIFCVLNIVFYWGANEEALANTEETMTLNVSRLFPHVRTQATYFEDAEFASRGEKMFCFRLVCSPLQQCEQHWLQIFPKSLKNKICQHREEAFGKHRRNNDFEHLPIVSSCAYPSNIL